MVSHWGLSYRKILFHSFARSLIALLQRMVQKLVPFFFRRYEAVTFNIQIIDRRMFICASVLAQFLRIVASRARKGGLKNLVRYLLIIIYYSK